MKLATEKQGVLSRLARDRRGNFGMMTALLLPVLLGAGGISIDVTKMMMTKNRLQDAADAAALAAASALANDGYSVDAAKLLALRFIETQMRSGGNVDGEGTDTKNPDSNEPSSFASSTIDIQETATGKSSKSWVINVTARTDMDLNPLTRLLVKDKAAITANTSAESSTESKSALSMYLVLDKSGSMLAPTTELSKQTSCDEYNNNQKRIYQNKSPCYVKKIEKLKTSAGLLFDYLNGADPSYKADGNPSSTYVRTGTASYDSAMRTSSSTAWGTNGARTQVNKLEADGGTSSTAAMNAAYTKLTEKGSDGLIKENKTHININGQIPTKYIVFMTDGINNNSNDDVLTLDVCKKAGKAGIIIFSIAFMAPKDGPEAFLEQCANETKGGKFFSAVTSKDLDAAFIEIGQQAAKTIARLTH